MMMMMMIDILRRWRRKIDGRIDDNAIFYSTGLEFGHVFFLASELIDEK